MPYMLEKYTQLDQNSYIILLFERRKVRSMMLQINDSIHPLYIILKLTTRNLPTNPFISLNLWMRCYTDKSDSSFWYIYKLPLLDFFLPNLVIFNRLTRINQDELIYPTHLYINQVYSSLSSTFIYSSGSSLFVQ